MKVFLELEGRWRQAVLPIIHINVWYSLLGAATPHEIFDKTKIYDDTYWGGSGRRVGQ